MIWEFDDLFEFTENFFERLNVSKFRSRFEPEIEEYQKLKQKIMDEKLEKKKSEEVFNTFGAKTDVPVAPPTPATPTEEPFRKQPPIGLVPQKYFLSDMMKRRLDDVNAAIQRYIEADMHLPEEWIRERNELIHSIEDARR